MGSYSSQVRLAGQPDRLVRRRSAPTSSKVGPGELWGWAGGRCRRWRSTGSSTAPPPPASSPAQNVPGRLAHPLCRRALFAAAAEQARSPKRGQLRVVFRHDARLLQARWRPQSRNSLSRLHRRIRQRRLDERRKISSARLDTRDVGEKTPRSPWLVKRRSAFLGGGLIRDVLAIGSDGVRVTPVGDIQLSASTRPAPATPPGRAAPSSVRSLNRRVPDSFQPAIVAGCGNRASQRRDDSDSRRRGTWSAAGRNGRVPTTFLN